MMTPFSYLLVMMVCKCWGTSSWLTRCIQCWDSFCLYRHGLFQDNLAWNLLRPLVLTIGWSAMYTRELINVLSGDTVSQVTRRWKVVDFGSMLRHLDKERYVFYAYQFGLAKWRVQQLAVWHTFKRVDIWPSMCFMVCQVSSKRSEFGVDYWPTRSCGHQCWVDDYKELSYYCGMS